MTDWLKQLLNEVDPKLVEHLDAQDEFQNKELQQRWDIAALGERGATERARIGASASTRNAQISAKASLKSAKLAAETQRYGIDTQAQTARERLGLDRDLGYGDLGLRALEMPSKFSGAFDPFQQSDLLHGLSQRQDVPAFVQTLFDASKHFGRGGAPGGTPQGFSVGSVLGSLAGQGGGAQSAVQGQNGTALAAIRELGARGFHALAPGALERLSPGEQTMLKNGLQYTGDNGPAWNWSEVLDSYERSRIGQGNPMLA